LTLKKPPENVRQRKKNYGREEENDERHQGREKLEPNTGDSELMHPVCRRPARVTVCSLRFDADAIVHGPADPLLTAEITFGCLHGYMTKQQFNLI
jgi:hypothetical protein